MTELADNVEALHDQYNEHHAILCTLAGKPFEFPVFTQRRPVSFVINNEVDDGEAEDDETFPIFDAKWMCGVIPS